MTRKCDKVHRVPMHSSVVIGGVSVGQCERDALPRMVVCWEHADRQAMAMVSRHLDADYKALHDMVTVERADREVERRRWQQDVDALTIQIEKLKGQK